MSENETSYDQLIAALSLDKLIELLGAETVKGLVLGSLDQLNLQQRMKLENAVGVSSGIKPSEEPAIENRMPDPLVQSEIE